MESGQDRLQMEKLDVLVGERSLTMRARRAVRIEDLQPLLEIGATLKAVKAAGATPTKAEFDALVDDVARLSRQLAAAAEALRLKLL